MHHDENARLTIAVVCGFVYRARDMCSCELAHAVGLPGASGSLSLTLPKSAVTESVLRNGRSLVGWQNPRHLLSLHSLDPPLGLEWMVAKRHSGCLAPALEAGGKDAWRH